jgi:hypothetical protein
MTIVVGHDLDPSILGEAARQAAAAQTARENVLRSLQARQQQAQQMLQAAGQAENARQFDIQNENDRVDRLARMHQQASQYQYELYKDKLKREDQEKKQANFDADNLLQRQKFEYQQQADKQQALVAQQNHDVAQEMSGARIVQDVDAGIAKRMDAVAAVQLNPEGQSAYKSWLSKYQSLQKDRREKSLSPAKYLPLAQQLASEYDSLGLHRSVVPQPTPEEIVSKSVVEHNGKRYIIKPSAHGNVVEPIDDAEHSQPKPFRAADLWGGGKESQSLHDKYYKLAKQQLIADGVRKWYGDNPDADKTPAQVEAMVVPSHADVVAAMGEMAQHDEQFAAKQFGPPVETWSPFDANSTSGSVVSRGAGQAYDYVQRAIAARQAGNPSQGKPDISDRGRVLEVIDFLMPKANRQSQEAYDLAVHHGIINGSEMSPRDFAVMPRDTFGQIVGGFKARNGLDDDGKGAGPMPTKLPDLLNHGFGTTEKPFVIHGEGELNQLPKGRNIHFVLNGRRGVWE